MAASGAGNSSAGELIGPGSHAAAIPRPFPTDITVSDEGYVVAAELVAEQIGLSPDVFWREMKRGIVYGVVERGEGEDAGRTRLTFRYRARSWSITLDEALQ